MCFPVVFYFFTAACKFVSCWHSFSFSEFPIKMFMVTAMFSWCVWVPIKMFMVTAMFSWCVWVPIKMFMVTAMFSWCVWVPIKMFMVTAMFSWCVWVPVRMFMVTAMFSWCVWVPVRMFFFPISMLYDCSMSCQYGFLALFPLCFGPFCVSMYFCCFLAFCFWIPFQPVYHFLCFGLFPV